MLDLIQYILLGIIQGLTEPLPVSSSGHLRIFSHFFGIGVPDLHLETFLNAASLIAVFIVFKKDLTELITGTISYVAKRRETDKEMFRFSVLIIIGTIPAVIIGGLFYDTFGAEFTQLHYVAAALLITGIALYIIRKLRGTKDEGQITITDAVIVGMAQSFALAPGISRSGATIVAALAGSLILLPH